MTSLVLAMSLVLAQRQDENLLKQVIGQPTGQNGYEEYVMAAERLRSAGFTSLVSDVQSKFPVGSAGYLSARTGLADRHPTLRALVMAGNRKPVFRPGAMNFDTLLPELSHFRSVARCLNFQATKEFAEGRYRDGADTLLAALTFSEKVSSSGVLIHYLVGIANTANCLLNYQEHLGRIPLSSLDSLVQHCDAALQNKPIRVVLEREVNALSQSLDPMLANPEDLFGDMDDADQADRDRRDLLKSMNATQRADLKRQFVAKVGESLRSWDSLIASDESKWITGSAMIENQFNDGSLLGWLYSSLMPVYSGTVIAEVRVRSQLRLLRLHALVHSHRLRTGLLPDTLEDLQRPADCADPLSGEKFQYTREGLDYELFSKGSQATGRVDLVYKRPKTDQEDVVPPRVRAERGQWPFHAR